jgi:aminoglycoside phosphotransferase (APT) family kinase protein
VRAGWRRRAVAVAGSRGRALRLAGLVAAARAESLAPQPAHGDVWPGNVFTTGDRVEVVDFEGATLASPYEDAAWFLVHLGLYLRRGAGGRLRRPLEAAFLEAWRGGGPADPAALAACRALAALELPARGRGGAVGRDPEALLARLVRRSALAREVRRALAEAR